MRQCVYSVTLVFVAHDTSIVVIIVFRFLHASFWIAYEAVRPPFLVRAYCTAIAGLALRPHSLMFAYTRAAAFYAPMLPFPVLA